MNQFNKEQGVEEQQEHGDEQEQGRGVVPSSCFFSLFCGTIMVTRAETDPEEKLLKSTKVISKEQQKQKLILKISIRYWASTELKTGRQGALHIAT